MKHTTRRYFVQRSAVATALVPIAMSESLLAQTAPASVPESAQEQMPEIEPKSPLAKALTDSVRAQWGDHLTLDELATIEDDIAGLVRYRSRLREVPLTNGDEPDMVFRASDAGRSGGKES